MPAAREVVLMLGAALTAIDKALVAVLEPESVTLTVKLEVPAAVGVPVIAPLEAFRLSPAGKVPVARDQL